MTSTTISVRSIHHVRKVFRKTHDPLWQMQSGVVLVICLQLITSPDFMPVRKLWLAIAEILLLVSLIIVTNEGYAQRSRARRNIAVVLIGVITAINIVSLILLINALIFNSAYVNGHDMLFNGLVIYVTNILLFALWYWEMDGNGPDMRAANHTKRDFLFPQMIHSRFGGDNWLPGFADYLYLASTNVTNFAAADTQPLTHRAKLLMLLQSLVAVVTVLLVLARAINILQ